MAQPKVLETLRAIWTQPTWREQPATSQHMLCDLWTTMDHGGFGAALAAQVLHFNGKLFKEPASNGYSLLLNQEQIDLLIAAAQANWCEVEPAIFGTLLPQHLPPHQRQRRHKRRTA